MPHREKRERAGRKIRHRSSVSVRHTMASWHLRKRHILRVLPEYPDQDGKERGQDIRFHIVSAVFLSLPEELRGEHRPGPRHLRPANCPIVKFGWRARASTALENIVHPTPGPESGTATVLTSAFALPSLDSSRRNINSQGCGQRLFPTHDHIVAEKTDVDQVVKKLAATRKDTLQSKCCNKFTTISACA